MVHWDRKAYRKQLFLQIILLLAVVALVSIFWEKKQGVSGGAETSLTLVESKHIPLKEISGVSSYMENGKLELAFIGDSNPKVVLHSDEIDREISFRETLLDRFSLCQDPDFDECAKSIKKLTENWEAIARDGSGRFFIMQEHSQSILVYDRSLQTIEGVLHFNLGDAFPDAVAHGAKKFKKNNLGEGLVLLKNGHVLIAKEQKPLAFVEFGPEGDKALGLSPSTVLGPAEAFTLAKDGFHRRLKPLHSWILTAHSKCDISDLALDGESRLLALSEICQSILVFNRLEVDRQALTQTILRLPREILHPEALTVVGKDWFVGSDKSSKTATNFYILRP